MKQITLNISDTEYETFMKFIKTLDYVSIEEGEIPSWQQKEVAKRIERIDSGEMTTRSWEEAEKEIFKK